MQRRMSAAAGGAICETRQLPHYPVGPHGRTRLPCRRAALPCFLSLQEIFGHNLGVASYGLLYGVMIVAWPAERTLSRFMLKHMRSQGRNFVRVVIVGTNTTAHRLYHEMNSDAGYGFASWAL